MMDEDILKRRLAETDRLNPSWKRLHQLGDEFMPALLFDAQCVVHKRGLDAKLLANLLLKLARPIGNCRDHVAADCGLQPVGRVERDQPALIQYSDPVT